MNSHLSIFCLLLASTVTVSAQIVVMDFNNLSTNPSGLIDAGSSITQNGFVITDTASPNSYYGYTDFLAAANQWQNGRGTSNGTTTIGLQSPNSSTALTFALSSATSKPFSFVSIDLGALNANDGQFYNSDATVWTLTGNLVGGGSVSYTINSAPNAFTTYDLPISFENLQSVDVKASIPVPGISISNGAGMTANFDNIVLSTAPLSAPEPKTYALMLVGMGMLALVEWRRRTRSARI